MRGATTTALHADIVTFSRTRGLYAGVSIEGSVLSPDTDSLATITWAAEYAGRLRAPLRVVLADGGNLPALYNAAAAIRGRYPELSLSATTADGGLADDPGHGPGHAQSTPGENAPRGGCADSSRDRASGPEACK